MIASASYAIVYTNNQRILNLTSLLSDPTAAKYVFQIWKACPVDGANEPQRQLRQSLLQGVKVYLIQTTVHVSRQHASQWFAAANEAVNVLYHLSPRFDKTAENVLKLAGKGLFLAPPPPRSTETASEIIHEGEGQSSQSDQPTQSSSQNATQNTTQNTTQQPQMVTESCLARFLFLLGQIALKLLQYCEQLTSRTKKSRMRHEEQEQQARKQLKQRRVSHSTLIGDDESNMGVVTQAADVEEDILEQVSTHGIVTE